MTDVLITNIRDAMRRLHKFSAEPKPERGTAEYRQRLWAQERALEREEGDAEVAAVEAFARLNGWKRTRNVFPPEKIGRRNSGPWMMRDKIFDHYLHFRGDGKNAAIVTQPYLDASTVDDEYHAWAARHGLRLSMPPDPLASFHYPGWTIFVVLTLADAPPVVWLPEQDGRLADLWQRMKMKETAS